MPVQEANHSLTAAEEKRLKQWRNQHEKRTRHEMTTHDRYRLLFSPTSIGTKVVAVCSCGKKKDITDYASW